ncbi:DUF2721 domain-containing protein [Glaciecola sp. 33A]|uniref:DUF2721 domain-containing protein n=1 Tax=Glaciecola sp. 33A TaxID=2057807 RepID=UPI000C31C8A9|nr:DUF2721 domain-containing protein [Glaciecola sp. 33A]PKI03588.1 DUF2721 domain-containing protein [Glaciecola sp. 33A]
METIITQSAVEIIQLALAPIFLIVGIGNLVNVATGRVSRIIDRARWFGNLAREEPERINEKAILEIRALNKRMRLANWSINFLVASAVVTCFTVMLVMINGLVSTNLDITIIITFMMCMVFLTGGLIAFFLEVSLATATLKIRAVDVSQFKQD